MKRTAQAAVGLLLLVLALPGAAVPQQTDRPLGLFSSLERLRASVSSYLGPGSSEARLRRQAASAVTPPKSVPAPGADASAAGDDDTDRGPGLDPNG